MLVHINGEEKEVEDGLTVTQLLSVLGLGGRRLAVEYNREVLPNSQWEGQNLRDGDALEIVHFVGGG